MTGTLSYSGAAHALGPGGGGRRSRRRQGLDRPTRSSRSPGSPIRDRSRSGSGSPADASTIHSNDVYSVQAGIIDGTSAWATAGGSLVITNGNPTSGIPLALTYRPDLLKGAVTGDLTGVGIAPSAGSYGVAVLVDVDTGAAQGIQYLPTVTSVPAPFSVPFNPTTIDKNRDYVVQGAIVDSSTRWENETGVPAITKGNRCRPQVVPAEAPAGRRRHRASRNIALIVVLLLIAVMVAAAYLIRRSQTPPDGVSPPPRRSPPARMRASTR